MNGRLNEWVPDDDFAVAYDPNLVPVASEAQNQAFLYEVDYVEIRTVPEPDGLLGLVSRIAGLAVLHHHRMRRSRGRWAEAAIPISRSVGK